MNVLKKAGLSLLVLYGILQALVLVAVCVGMLLFVKNITIDDFFSKDFSDSYTKCNSLAQIAETNLKPMFESATIDGQTFQCRKFVGDPPTRLTTATYTLRGAADPLQTYPEVLASKIDQQLTSLGWEKQPKDQNYVWYVLKSNRMVKVRFTTISPPYNVYGLQATIDDSFDSSKADRSKPDEIALPKDYYIKYPPLEPLIPSFIPVGYTTWTRDRDPDSNTVAFQLTGGTGEARPRLKQRTVTSQEITDGVCKASDKYICEVVATGKHGNPIYLTNNGFGERKDTLVTQIGNTHISLIQFIDFSLQPAVPIQDAPTILSNL